MLKYRNDNDGDVEIGKEFPVQFKKPIIFYQSYFILFITVFFYVISIQMPGFGSED